MRAGQTYGIAVHAHGPGTLYADASITVGTVGGQPIHPGNLFYYDGFDNGPDYDACSSSGCSVGPTDLIFEVDSSVSYESFNAYYNNGLSPGFYAFQDSFSQANYTRPNEPWTVNNGTWVTSSGVAFRDTSFNTGGWTTESSAVSNTSQDTTDGETDKLSATFTAGTAGFYRIVRSFATAIDGNVYPKLVVRLKSSIAKNLLRVEIRDGVTWHDPTDGNSDLWKKSAGWTIAVLNLQGWSSINTLKLGITSEFDTSISGPQSGWFDYAFIANDVPTSQDDMVGQYSGSLAGGAQEAVFAWSDIGKPDISIQARVFILSKLATSEARVGLMTHYAGSGLGKWALVVHNTTSGVKLSLLEEYVAWRVETSCTGVTTKNWYTLNFTIRGVSATGWLSGPNGLYCPVSGSFGGGSLSTATGFGLYSGGYSALFDNLVVATVFPYLASKSFSNSFITNGAPGQNIHSAVAGTAQLTNGTTTSPAESYFSYYSWGGINQSKQRYDPTPPAVQWLTTSTVYDTYGNPKTSIDARSYPTYYTYSANYTYAYLTNQTRLDGVTKITTLYAYNLTTGNVRIVTDPKGNATSYQNDNLGRVKRIAYPLGAYVNYTYNDSANYVDTVNENKTKTRQIYDGLARQTIVDKFLNGASYSNETSRYNWQSKILNRTDTLGNVYRFAYDVVGRTVNATRPNGKSTLQFYNDLASWIRTMDEDGNYKCTIYDRLGRLVSVVERAAADCQTGIVTNYYYNEVGNLRKVTNSLSKSTSYTYDNLGQLTKTVYPDNYNETYTYDNNGNMVNSTDRNSVKTMRSYDSLNRLKTITYCGSLGITPIIGTSYTYDKNGNPLQMKNENATVTYIYDARNRVLNETSAVNLANRQVVDLGCFGPGGTLTRNGGVSKTYIVGFTYKGEYLDTLMYPTISQSNPDITIRYAYDGLGRVLNVTRIGTSTYYARSFTYYKSNQVKGMQFGNSLIGNYTYDNLSRPSTIALSGATTMSLTYTYNNTGTVASVVGALNGATVNEQYRYDALQRLTNYTTTSSASTTSGWYEYDNAGNRLRQKLNSTITAYSYNSLNQLINSTAYTTPQTKIYYGYDLNGNLKIQNVTTSGTVRWTYAWDAANHLLKVTNSTGQALYAYDGMGRMVEQVESSSTWFLAYKGTEILYKNLLNTNNQAYVFAAGLKIARVVDRTAMYYYHTDPLGSTRMITYNDATFVFKDNYQPFGRDNGTPTGNLANTEKDRFTGKTYSSATGLYYYYHRWYDPSVGRFVSWDPQPGELTSPQTGNVYVYVINSPVNYNDPRGEFFNVLIGAIAGAAIGGAVCAWQHGGWSNSCLTSIAIGALAGAVAGLTFNPALGLAAQAGLSGLGASVLAGAISGAVSGVASYGAQGISATASGQQFNWSVTDLAVSVGLGALGGAAGGAVGYGVGRLVSSLGRGGSGAIGKIAGGLEDGGSKSIRLAQGATLRRVFGGGSKPFGPSWTTMDSATPGFPDALELPPTNDMNGIMSAYFPPGTPVTIMKTTGGAVEVVVDRAWFWAALPRVISW